VPLRVKPTRDRRLNRLIKSAELEAVGRGDVLFDAGDRATDVLLVRSGHVRFEVTGERGKRCAIAVAGPWELIEEGAMCGGAHRCRAVAGEATSVQRFDGGAARRAVQRSEPTLSALLAAQNLDLERARRFLGSGTHPSAASRLASVVLDLADRWGEPKAEGLFFPQRVTHQLLGDLAGEHRSTVTTTLNEWLYDGILGTAKRGLWVADPGRLARIAGSLGTCSGSQLRR
jgi:CRP/FNR family transcriptional regulator, cyclic AMP receptor protein